MDETSVCENTKGMLKKYASIWHNTEQNKFNERKVFSGLVRSNVNFLL